jgi:uncharacterized protein YgbK (DUF1537 family)
MTQVSLAATIRIIADDLTGALDAAAPLAARVGSFSVQWNEAAAASPRAALDTGTREADPATAVRRVRGAAALWWRDFEGLALKKVDSLWRGHCAAEITAAIEGGGFDKVIVAPAFPAQRRRTRAGAQWVDDDECGRCVCADLAADLRCAGLRAVRENDARPADNVLVCDAETHEDLVALVQRYRRCSERVLWCGSGGLAHALSSTMFAASGIPVSACGVCESAPVIVLVGSQDPVAQRQAQLLAARSGVRDIRLALDRPDDGASACMSRDGASTLLIRFAVAPHTPSSKVRALAQAALERAVPRWPRAGAAVVTGGETLRALAHALGASALRVHCECEPGVAMATWSDGAWAGLPVYTKSGGFGAPGLLVELASAAAGARAFRT